MMDATLGRALANASVVRGAPTTMRGLWRSFVRQWIAAGAPSPPLSRREHARMQVEWATPYATEAAAWLARKR